MSEFIPLQHRSKQANFLKSSSASNASSQISRSIGGFVSAERNWDGSTMPSQKDKLAIVTGANSGIGFEAAKALAAHPGLTHSDIWNRYYRSTFPYWLAEIFVWLLSWVPFRTSQMGALPILYAATVKSVKGGEYYGPNGFLHMRGYPALEAGAKLIHSLENANKLWKLREDTLNEKFKL